MPIFEYYCRSCRKKTSALVLSRAREAEVRCRHCGGADLEKLWSRFASPKSEDARLESLADPSALGGLDENDPRSVAKFMKKMGQEMGEDDLRRRRDAMPKKRYDPAATHDRWVVNKLRALCGYYTKGFEGGSHLRVAVNQAPSVAALRSLIEAFFAELAPSP